MCNAVSCQPQPRCQLPCAGGLPAAGASERQTLLTDRHSQEDCRTPLLNPTAFLAIVFPLALCHPQHRHHHHHLPILKDHHFTYLSACYRHPPRCGSAHVWPLMQPTVFPFHSFDLLCALSSCLCLEYQASLSCMLSLACKQSLACKPVIVPSPSLALPPASTAAK